jgi:hypothetical protein
MTAVVAMIATAQSVTAHTAQLDTDALPIHVDNCAAATISNREEEFVKGSLVPVKESE